MSTPKPTGDDWTVGHKYMATDYGDWEQPKRRIRMTVVDVRWIEHAGWVRTVMCEVLETETE